MFRPLPLVPVIAGLVLSACAVKTQDSDTASTTDSGQSTTVPKVTPPTGPTKTPGSTPTKPVPFQASAGWACMNEASCQDVFDFEFAAGSTVSFAATAVTGASVAQLAVYAPGEPLGGTNLLTGTTDEYRCTDSDDCAYFEAGEAVDFVAKDGGTYRLAITRNYGQSCGSKGTYAVSVISDLWFPEPTQTVDDVASVVKTSTCPL